MVVFFDDNNLSKLRILFIVIFIPIRINDNYFSAVQVGQLVNCWWWWSQDKHVYCCWYSVPSPETSGHMVLRSRPRLSPTLSPRQTRLQGGCSGLTSGGYIQIEVIMDANEYRIKGMDHLSLLKSIVIHMKFVIWELSLIIPYFHNEWYFETGFEVAILMGFGFILFEILKTTKRI